MVHHVSWLKITIYLLCGDLTLGNLTFAEVTRSPSSQSPINMSPRKHIPREAIKSPMTSHDHYIWVNYNNSLTWIKAHLGMISLINYDLPIDKWMRTGGTPMTCRKPPIATLGSRDCPASWRKFSKVGARGVISSPLPTASKVDASTSRFWPPQIVAKPRKSRVFLLANYETGSGLLILPHSSIDIHRQSIQFGPKLRESYHKLHRNLGFWLVKSLSLWCP
jgi:hypothetical protein